LVNPSGRVGQAVRLPASEPLDEKQVTYPTINRDSCLMCESVDVLIVGAGFSGLCMAIQLRESRHGVVPDHREGEDLGGTWWYNRYPGCACDIPSHLYSFSFDRNPEWTRMVCRTAGDPGLPSGGRTASWHCVAGPLEDTAALRRVWDEQQGVWHAVAAIDVRIDARVLVSGMGALHVPRYPELNGIERFRGEAFHSGNWDSRVNLEGKNVAVIGTGASSVQFVRGLPRERTSFTSFSARPHGFCRDWMVRSRSGGGAFSDVFQVRRGCSAR